MGKKDNNKTNKGKDSSRPNKQIIEDERFSKLHHDPRFVRPSKIKNKVKVDDRFKALFDGDMAFQTKAKVDKYGRKQVAAVKEDLSRFYDIENEEDKTESSDEDGTDEEEESEKSEEEEEEVEELDEHAKMLAISRGELLVGSDSDYSTEEEYDLEQDFKMVDETIPRGDETKRFACMNMDWDNIKAKDLFKVFNSFKPEQGSIISVSIYPSQFGKLQIEKEQLEGPPKEIFDKSIPNQNELVQDDDDEEFNQEKLKKYQLERLKYYYAVVECDDVATAKHIYDQCDENEYESSANFFDLRFIPDDMQFDEEPRDTATEEPLNYKAALFTTNALTNSKVELTWDNDDPERIQLITDAFTKKDLDNMDFTNFLASASEDEDIDPDSARAKYLNLIKESKQDMDSSDGDEDMEIKFTAGLNERKMFNDSEEEEEQEVKPVKEETSVEKYLRKQREKLAAKKELKAQNKLKAEPKLTEKQTKITKQQAKAQSDKEKAELELLLLDSNSNQPSNHFDMEAIVKAEKKGRKRNKKKRGTEDAGEVQEEFEIDTEDPRFAAIKESNNFHIDPTHPQFKKTKAMQKLIQARHQPKTDNNNNQDAGEMVPTVNENAKLKQLVDSVKRQTKKFHSNKKQ